MAKTKIISNMSQEFHMKVQMGILTTSPNAIGITGHVNHDYKYTWAEKRRDKLVYRLQLIKAWRNRVFAGLLVLVLIFFSLCIVAWLDGLAHSDYDHFMIGILGAELIMFSCFAYTFIPTDPYNLYVKHKGKLCR